MARLKTGRAHNGNEHAVDIVTTCKLANRLSANTELGTLRQLLQHGIIAMGSVRHSNRRN